MPKDISEERKIRIKKIYMSIDNQNVISNVKNKIFGLSIHSFQNPMSPQGLLILAFIINIYLLKFYWKKDCLNL